MDGPEADLLDVPQEDLALRLRESRDAVCLVDMLQEPVDEVGEPRDGGMRLDEIVELVAVEDQDFLSGASHRMRIDDGDAEEMRDNFSGAVVVAADPGDADRV